MVLALLVGGSALLVLSPVWLVLASVVDLLARRFRLPTPRLLIFATTWCWLEIFGVLAATIFWVIGQGRNQRLHYALQRMWAAGLIGSLRLTVGMVITVEGTSHLEGGPFIALCRHASLADSLVSAWVFGTHGHLQPRYVLKKELQMDPCLDIVGHRVPNYFVNRASSNMSGELEGIAQMAADLNAGDVAVIFPEGSRANPKKRERELNRISQRDPERGARLAGLRYLIAPKIAGAKALIESVPRADVLTVWHSGFDGMDTFSGMWRQLSQRAIRAKVVVQRHSRSTLPVGPKFAEWLDDRWVEMDQAVATSA
jgi:hypothetical protein